MSRFTKALPKSKVCRTCGHRKPISTKTGINFWKNSSNEDGLRDECKDCFYEWRNANNEKLARAARRKGVVADAKAQRLLLVYVLEVA